MGDIIPTHPLLSTKEESMVLDFAGRIEWKLILQETGEVIDEGAQDNIVLDFGRKQFLGGWHGGSVKDYEIVVASGTTTPDYTDTTIPTAIAWSNGSGHAFTTYNASYVAPTVSYQTLFDVPPENYTVNKVGLARYGSVTGSRPSGIATKPFCVVKLSTPIIWTSSPPTQLDIRYQVTIEKYEDD